MDLLGTVLLPFIFILSTEGFNVIYPSKAIRFYPQTEREVEFGYSLTITSDRSEKWLLVGAPKDDVGNRNGSQYLHDGAVYSCPFVGNEKDNSSCTKVDLARSYRSARRTLLLSIDFTQQSFDQLTEEDDFDWKPYIGVTPSANTGPSSGHSQDSQNGTYMFIESSRPRTVGETAMLVTDELPQTSGSCVRFWYNMLGDDMGSLNVYVAAVISGYRMIWSVTGDQGENWIEGWATIISEEPYKIIFEGVVGQGYRSDIGLDDVTAHEGSCVEDSQPGDGSLGMTLENDPLSGNVLACAPTWIYSCEGQDHMTGLCYLMNGSPSSLNATMISPCRYPGCNDGRMDVVFLIDGSDSINIIDFRSMILWLSNVVSSLIVVKDLTRVGIAQYSSSPQTEFHLNEYHTIEDLRKAIRKIKHKKGNTATGKAIEFITNEMFNEERGMRPGVKHIAVIVTDGKSQDDVAPASERAKAKGITIFAIGVTSSSEESELRIMSSDPDEEYVYSVDSYKALDGIRSQLQKKFFSLESQDSTFTTERCQSGASGTFIQGQPVIGLPGLQDWSGGFAIKPKGSLLEEKRSLQEILGITVNNSTESGNSSFNIKKKISDEVGNSYFGYSMSSGSYSHQNAIEIAVGAPRWRSKGGVFIVNATSIQNMSLVNKYEGEQMGSCFGYSVCMTDMNNDGISELIVGAPMHFEKHENEGRVVIYISASADSDQSQHMREKIILTGHLEKNARFGFSVAAAGDINGDMYGDIVVGAPSSRSGDGAVFIYNGRADLKTLRVPSQVLRSSSMASKPKLFGFSLSAGTDIDGNSHPDLSVGAPGSDEAFVMLSRPVIHVKARIRSIPNTVNVSKSTCFIPKEFDQSFAPKACSAVEICFAIHGKAIPQIILLEYKLFIDGDKRQHSSRAKFVNPRNEIATLRNRVKCINETLAFKESLYDFNDVTIGVGYKLSSKVKYTENSPMLNIFDENPVRTKIKLTRWCKNVNCESDLQIYSSVDGVQTNEKYKLLIINKDRIITLKVKLENKEDIALLTKVIVHYHNGLYFSHIIQDDHCITIYDKLVQDQNRTEAHCFLPNCTFGGKKMEQIHLKHTNPIMKPNIPCKFSLQFGIADEAAFYDDNLTFSLHATSESIDMNEKDNAEDITIPMYFMAKATLHGFTDMFEVPFSLDDDPSNLTLNLNDIGPNSSVSYFITNTGYSIIPQSSIKIEWPDVTVDGNGILYLMEMECIPESKCLCEDFSLLVNPLNLSESDDLHNQTHPGNLTVGMDFKRELWIDCDKGDTECAAIDCSIFDFNPSDVIQVTLRFRIWERTLSESCAPWSPTSIHSFDVSGDICVTLAVAIETNFEIWRANIVTSMEHSKEFASHKVILNPPASKHKIPIIAVSRHGNSNKDDNSTVRMWVVILAIGIGVLLLSVLILVLYKVRFFESKYRQRKEESLEWHDYRCASVHEGRVKVQLKVETDGDSNIHKLSTFQR